MMMRRTYPNPSWVANPRPSCKGLVLSSTTLACSTPGPSHCPTCMRMLSGQSRRHPLIPTAASPQTIMQDSSRRISSIFPHSASNSRPYTQHSNYVLAWRRMGVCWWTSTPSFSPSSTPCACSWTRVTTSTSSPKRLWHFAILDNSNLVGECQAHLLDAIALANASTTNQSTNGDSVNWNYSKQSGKNKDASPAYPNKPYPQPQSPSLISVPFPQSSITALGDGGTMLQCPAKHRVLLCTAAEQVEEDWRHLHNPLLDQEQGTPPPPQCSPTLCPPQLLSGQSPDSFHGGRTFPSPLPRGHSPLGCLETPHISPIGLVPKKNSGSQLIIGMQLLNIAISLPCFKYKDLALLAPLLKEGDYMTKIDLTDGFFHLLPRWMAKCGDILPSLRCASYPPHLH